jgi:hypothetical protein
MTEAGRPFRLGIIGGCMSHQPGIPMNALFHRRLARLLEDDPGVRLRPRIVRSFESGYCERLAELLGEGPLDGLLVHVRITATARSVLFVRARREGRVRRRLNPALVRRRHRPEVAWEQPWGGDEARARTAAGGGAAGAPDWDRPHGRRLGRIRFASVNYMLGALVGLDRWAIEDELLRLGELDRACREARLPLFVLGPTPAPDGRWQRRMVGTLNAALRRRTSELGLPCALIDPGDAQLPGVTLGDGVHMSVEGHRVVAETLYRGGMREWVRGSGEARS